MEGLFKDKVYHEMDWLEAACQPIQESVNAALAEFPERIEVTVKHIRSHHGEPTSIWRNNFLHEYAQLHNLKYNKLHYNDKLKIHECFKFVGEGDIYYNSETGELHGDSIFLIKVKEMFDEGEIEKMLGELSIDKVKRLNSRDIQSEYANDILELFSLDEARKTRSKKQKLIAIKNVFIEIMSKNQWNIKDMELSNRVGKWLVEYLKTGNMAALANFCKLKAMTHSDEPIYSIEEEAL